MMKTRILLLFSMAVLLSCDKDTDDDNVALEDKWTLVDAQCFCASTGDDLSKNILVFNTADNIATFSNNEASDDNVWIPSATYDFRIKSDSLKLIGKFDHEPAKSSGFLSSLYKIKGNTLTLVFDPMPSFIDDEFTLIYKRQIF